MKTLSLSGNKDRHEILVTDRYTHFWIYDNKLEVLWKRDGQTGHYPNPIDLNQSRACTQAAATKAS